MVSKDQAIGGAIFVICVVIAILYVVTLFYPQWLVSIGLVKDLATFSYGAVQFWVLAIPVLIAFVAIMAIGAWIGWTMATTPPPKPIEEITKELEETKEETTEAKETEEAKEEKSPKKEQKAKNKSQSQ